jgi:hypothetical protein
MWFYRVNNNIVVDFQDDDDVDDVDDEDVKYELRCGRDRLSWESW